MEKTTMGITGQVVETVDNSTEEVPRADELTTEQLEEFARNYRLVCLLKSGRSVREALQRLTQEFKSVPRTERWVWKVYARYQKEGAKGLLDGRRSNKNSATVLTDEVKQIVRAWWYARPAAGPKAIWQQVKNECREREIRSPKYDSVKKFIKSFSAHDKLVRAGKIETWDKQFRPVARFNLTSYSNERWQIDHSRLDIWIRERIKDAWTPSEVWITVVLDAHSRTIAGFWLSTACPDAWTTAILLRSAVLPKQNSKWRNKGLPSVLQPDRGADFMSHAVAASLAYLSVFCDPDPPYYPQRKGRIERWFRTVDTGCLRVLPGHHAAIGMTRAAAEKHTATFLTRWQLAAEIERWIVDDYHARVHSETGRKPAEHWEETVRMRMPESEDALDNMLLKSDKERKVRNTGIDFHIGGKRDADMRGGRYWAPELAYHTGGEVRLRYNPEDLDSMLVYNAATGKYICEAWVMGRDDSKYNIADIKQSRSQYRQGLVERMKTYAAEIHHEDRRKARQTECDEARSLAEEMETAAAIGNDNLKDVGNIDDLLALFERRDRGVA